MRRLSVLLSVVMLITCLGSAVYAGGDSLPESVTFKGASLSLKSEPTLSLYFVSDSELSFDCAGRTVQTTASGIYQVARIRDINITDMDTDITLTVSDGITSGTISYCPLTYCYNALNGGTDDEKLITVCKALFVYWQQAEGLID